MISYAFVLDANGERLAPTKEVKAWYLIRKKRATLVSKYPMVIQLNKEVPNEEKCKDEIRCGIDDGGLHVGIALVQKCQSKNKVLFKGTIEQRKDVKRLMEIRRDHRRYHRNHKRHRQARFNNRASSKRKGRIAPSILQKRQATLRVVNQLNKWITITSYWLEDVSIDIRALTDGYKPYKWQYQKSNRMDENIRKAAILRDDYKCRECGKTGCRLEVHHIRPRRQNGSNALDNLITLCEKCHQKTEGCEDLYSDRYFSMLKSSDNKNLNYAQHTMIGKQWLRDHLSILGTLYITNGGDTANKRIDWGIEKTHANDAICITNLQPLSCEVKEWMIKPMRKRSRAKTDSLAGFKQRDFVEYTYKNGETYRGYIIALSPKWQVLKFQSRTKICLASIKKCKLLWRYSKIYWLDNDF